MGTFPFPFPCSFRIHSVFVLLPGEVARGLDRNNFPRERTSPKEVNCNTCMRSSPSDSNILVSFVLLMKSHLQSYPCPLQINSFWNLGFLLGITIILQIITGIFLGLHYTSDLNSAYSSVFFFIREIYYGWCLRYLHSSGASFVFLFLFLTFKCRIHGLWIINVGYILMSHIY